MAQSKNDKNRKKKKEQFKEKAKETAVKQRIPRTHLIPIPTWQSNENLDARGDLIEAFEQQLVIAMDAIQKCGQALQYMIQMNIKSEKIKLQYEWNNGEKPTQKEIDDFLALQAKATEERKKQMLELQEKLQKDANQAIAEQNQEITGLVGPDGQPIGTNKPLVEQDEAEDEDEDESDDDSTDEQPSDNDDDKTSEE
jgi:hypothetical protein